MEFYQSQPTEPTTRENGQPLVAGDMWYNTTTEVFSIYNGTTFVAVDDTPAWVPTNDPHYLDNGQALIFYDLAANPDASLPN